MKNRVSQNHMQLSVIIPTYRDDAALSRLLTQLRGYDVYEIIVVDGEDRWTMPDHFSGYDRLVWKTAPHGRGPQIARGLACAKGDNFWVLHADSDIHENSLKEISNILKDGSFSLGMFRLSFNRQRWVYRLFEFFTRFDTALTSFGDQGFFFRREDLDIVWPALHPMLAQAPILEDVILRRQLKSLGRVKKSRLKIGTSPNRFERRGLWRTQCLNAVILFRARMGTPALQLYHSYYAPPIRSLLKEKTRLKLSKKHSAVSIEATVETS